MVTGMWIDMCTDVRPYVDRHVYSHVYVHACRHVYRDMRANTCTDICIGDLWPYRPPPGGACFQSHVEQRRQHLDSCGLDIYGLDSYGPYSYGLYSYSFQCRVEERRQRQLSHGLYIYGLYSDGIYSYSFQCHGASMYSGRT